MPALEVRLQTGAFTVKNKTALGEEEIPLEELFPEKFYAARKAEAEEIAKEKEYVLFP